MSSNHMDRATVAERLGNAHHMLEEIRTDGKSMLAALCEISRNYIVNVDDDVYKIYVAEFDSINTLMGHFLGEGEGSLAQLHRNIKALIDVTGSKNVSFNINLNYVEDWIPQGELYFDSTYTGFPNYDEFVDSAKAFLETVSDTKEDINKLIDFYKEIWEASGGYMGLTTETDKNNSIAGQVHEHAGNIRDAFETFSGDLQDFGEKLMRLVESQATETDSILGKMGEFTESCKQLVTSLRTENDASLFNKDVDTQDR